MSNIRHKLFIAAPAEKVYTAIVSQEGLSAWWTSDTIAKAEVGTIARFSFGPDYFKEMKITTLTPGKLVKWLCISGTGEWIGTSISFQLEYGTKASLLNAHPEMQGQLEQHQHADDGTLLTFQHDDWKDYTPMFAECNYTWGQFLKSLKLFCETGKGTPFPHQHQ